MDLQALATTGAAAYVTKDLLVKILGPTADYVGGEIKGLVQKCNVNLEGIFAKAARKLGDRIEEEGAVSPRVLKHVIDEGRFCDDDLTAEYYGGILASSKNRIARDDRGVTLLATVKALSVYQLRTHFIAYAIIHQLFKGQKLSLGNPQDRYHMRVFMPKSKYEIAMDFQDGEDLESILTHSFAGLKRHDLIAEAAYGSAEFLKAKQQGITEPGLIFGPTMPGAELFLWATGLPGSTGRELLSVDMGMEPDVIVIPNGSKALTELEGASTAEAKEEDKHR